MACTPPTYAGLIEASFNQIRQNGADKPIIVLHMLEAIGRIAEHVRLPAQHAALSDQAKVIVEAGRRQIADEFDRKRIEERYAAVQRSLNRVASALAFSAPPPWRIMPLCHEARLIGWNNGSALRSACPDGGSASTVPPGRASAGNGRAVFRLPGPEDGAASRDG